MTMQPTRITGAHCANGLHDGRGICRRRFGLGPLLSNNLTQSRQVVCYDHSVLIRRQYEQARIVNPVV